VNDNELASAGEINTLSVLVINTSPYILSNTYVEYLLENNVLVSAGKK
jgi:hypothetical protein